MKNNFEIEIIKQGAVVIDHIYIVKQTKDIILIGIELNSKYISLDSSSNDSSGNITITTSANKRTLYKHDKNKGFTIFSIKNTQKYQVFNINTFKSTIRLTLFKN